MSTVLKLPIQPNSKLTKDDLTRWPHLQGLELPAVKAQEVQLLIGVDNPEVFWTLDERHRKKVDAFDKKYFPRTQQNDASRFQTAILSIRFLTTRPHCRLFIKNNMFRNALFLIK